MGQARQWTQEEKEYLESIGIDVSDYEEEQT